MWSEHQSLYARACASAKSTSRSALQPEQHRRVEHREVDAVVSMSWRRALALYAAGRTSV